MPTHGEWKEEDCQACVEAVEAWNNGYAAGKKESAKEIADLKKAYELLFKQNAMLRATP